MSAEKTNWDKERAVYESRLPPVVPPEFQEPWIGTQHPTEEAMRIIKNKEFKEIDFTTGKETGHFEDDDTSGRNTALNWLRKKQIREQKSEEEQEGEELKVQVCDITKRIEKAQDKILSNCWNRLPLDCPLKKGGELKFFFDWHNIDGRIFPCIDPKADIWNSILQYEVVYKHFIQSDNYKKGLITIENFELNAAKLKLYDEHLKWIDQEASDSDRNFWNIDRNACVQNIKATLSKQPLHLFIVAATDYLKCVHLKNGIPLPPTIDQVKKVLYKEFPEIQNNYKDRGMKGAIVQARRFISIGEKGVRGSSVVKKSEGMKTSVDLKNPT